MGKGRKYALDWLRAIACIAIMAMHLRQNISYEIPGYIFNKIVPSFTDFVYLFMAISSFGLCCGYYQRFTDGRIDWENFYKRRFSKILPFFITMILLDLVMGFSFDSLMQGLVEAILFHGFIPVEFNVIGVGWFLGVVFIFYLSFPFFCVLLKNKKRGWIAFAIFTGLNLISRYHFDIGRDNFAFSFCFFFIGGMIFLYRDKIENMKWWYLVPVMIPCIVVYYLKPNTITVILVTASILALAVSLDIPSFKPVSFISGISMEIYLCHMVIFRALERFHILGLLGTGIVPYLITCILVLIGACVMAVCVDFVLDKLIKFISKLSPGHAQ